jgi:hypothetical protein
VDQPQIAKTKQQHIAEVLRRVLQVDGRDPVSQFWTGSGRLWQDHSGCVSLFALFDRIGLNSKLGLVFLRVYSVLILEPLDWISEKEESITVCVDNNSYSYFVLLFHACNGRDKAYSELNSHQKELASVGICFWSDASSWSYHHSLSSKMICS